MDHLKTFTRNFHFAVPALLSLATFAAIQVNQIDPASACRDCPFPTPISALHWLMPSGHSEIMVEEINLGRGKIQSVVRLIDAMTGELLAIGHLDHAKGRKRITVEIFDKDGGKMEAQLYYTNHRRDRVRIRITCEKCNVDESYLN